VPISVLSGSTPFGVLGALLAIPVAASIQITIREYWTLRRLAIVPTTSVPEASSGDP
jgi:predicted PurR-regulated permease PerM